jgi:hypothetical protein
MVSLCLLRGNDFLETLPVALVELKGFVEAILEVIDPPLLGDLILEAPRYDEAVDRVDDGLSGDNRKAAGRR